MKAKHIIWAVITATIVITTLSLTCCNHEGYGHRDGISIGNGGLRYKYGDCIFNPKNGKKLIENIEWIYETDDSIGIVAKDGKRGYVNLNTAEWIVPLEYHKAWAFSSSRGCMSRGDSLFIFDRNGQQVGCYPYVDEYERVFYKGYLVVSDWADRKKVGLIDTACQWSLPAEYESIRYEYPQKGYYNARKKDYCLLFDHELDTVLHGAFEELQVDWSEGIIATEHNGMQHLYNYHGEMLYEQIFRDIRPAFYDTGRKDKEGNPIYEETDCYIYSNYSGKEGLMNRHYHCITAPLFYELEARGRHLFFATFGEYYSRFGTLIDDSGRPVR